MHNYNDDDYQKQKPWRFVYNNYMMCVEKYYQMQPIIH